MKNSQNIFGVLIGKISNIFISFIIRFFMYRQYKGFSSAAAVFDQNAQSTPNFK